MALRVPSKNDFKGNIPKESGLLTSASTTAITFENRPLPPDPLTLKANHDHWEKRALWRLDEAIYLVKDIEPCGTVNFKKIDHSEKSPRLANHYERQKILWELYQIAKTAIEAGQLKPKIGPHSENPTPQLDPRIHGAFFGNKLDPKDFVTWAAKIIDIPEQLKNLIIPEESMAPEDLALLADFKAYLDPNNPYYVEEGAIGFLVWRDHFRNKEYLEKKSQKRNSKFKADIEKTLEKKYGLKKGSRISKRISTAQNPDKTGGAQSSD